MGLFNVIKPLLVSRERREVLLALTAAYMLVQISSFPIAISLPTIADYFGAGLNDVAWIIIMYLLVLGGFVMLGARAGDRYGHERIFFVGIVISTLGAVLVSVSGELWQVILWRGFAGLGAGLIMGNANAILAATFPPEERGRAFSIPIVGSRFGTLAGFGLFGLFLQFLSWRLIFISFLPLGIIAIAASIPMLRHSRHTRPSSESGGIDWLGAVFLLATITALVLSTNHLHGGDESFTSPEGLSYHLPMQGLFVVLLVVFIFIERFAKNPLVDLKLFKQKYFSMALTSNVSFHFSMLATMTLIPILIQEGFGKAPLYVTLILLPNQLTGVFMTGVAGWIHDRYSPKLLRPGSMVAIALGFLLMGLFVGQVSIWMIPVLMLPISIGSAMFNPVNNAIVMGSLPIEHRGFASGMLETTREMGHALGATVSATVLAMVLPAGIALMSDIEAQRFYFEGFKFSSLMVIFILLAGALLAFLQKSAAATPKPAQPQTEPSFEPSGDDD
ncbi:MAG: MFS transporter [Chloroflexi bacterium]|nr:MFS transporter [Chloroflexota bacterium]